MRSNVHFQKSILNVAKMCIWLQKGSLSFLLYVQYLSVSSYVKNSNGMFNRKDAGTEYIVLDVAKKHILIGCKIACISRTAE